MTKRNFTTTIEAPQSPQEVFNRIKEVSKWWGGKDLSGSSTKLDDEFVIHHRSAHYSKQKLIEVIPNKKMVWLVTESTLYWLKKDKNEWTNTKMIFELTSKDDKTIINFTHEGLVPGKECYKSCEQGWNMVIKDYLFNYITYSKIAEQLYR
jgi:Activator of Hsp90 ATPase homolog 1-like protein